MEMTPFLVTLTWGCVLSNAGSTMDLPVERTPTSKIVFGSREEVSVVTHSVMIPIGILRLCE